MPGLLNTVFLWVLFWLWMNSDELKGQLQTEIFAEQFSTRAIWK